MAEDDTPASNESVDLPDIRVVSVVHDADKDRLGVIHDDDLDPHHALGLLVHGVFIQLQNVEAFDYDLVDDDDRDED
jgi:hypothetical protein